MKDWWLFGQQNSKKLYIIKFHPDFNFTVCLQKYYQRQYKNISNVNMYLYDSHSFNSVYNPYYSIIDETFCEMWYILNQNVC